MIDFKNIDNALFLALLSPVLLAIGYFYRSMRESKKNKKLALYVLLEIWHMLSVFHRKDFDDFFELVIGEINSRYPREKISENEMAAIKVYLEPILKETLRDAALSDLDSYQEKYQEVIALISSDDPVFAYQLSSISKTKKFLSFLDLYLTRLLNGVEDDSKVSSLIKAGFSEYAWQESVRDLESDIRTLSRKISIFTYLVCNFSIRKRKKMISKIERRDVIPLVENLVRPMLDEIKNSIRPISNTSID